MLVVVAAVVPVVDVAVLVDVVSVAVGQAMIMFKACFQSHRRMETNLTIK